MKILLIDANESFAHHLRGELLSSVAMLCDLERAGSLADAATLLGNERFDAIIVDPHSLPDATPSVLGDLQQVAQRAPVLVLSDQNDDALAVAAVRQGAQDYLIKYEAQPEFLLRRVRFAIDRQHGQSARAKLAGPHRRKRQPALAQQGVKVSEAALAPSISTSEGSFAAPYEDAGEAVQTEPTTEFSPADATTDANAWHVLHIEDDPVFVSLSDKLLRCDSPHPLKVTRASHLAEATTQLETTSYDAVILELTLADSSGLDTLGTVLQHAGEAPVVVITSAADAATTIDGMRCGAEDFLSKSEPDLRFLRRATQLAIVRRDRALRMPPLPEVEHAAPAAPASSQQPATAERRRHTRYLLTKPIFVTPVLPDGSPAATYSADGFSVNVSEGGLRFEIGNLQRLPTTHLLVGIEGLDTVLYFATVEARHVVPKGNGLDVGAQFAKNKRDLIRKENLEPTFNPATAKYETGLPLDVIMKWVDFGIFRPALFDRTIVCPQCRAIPTFRNGCRVCGSVRLHSRPLIHHFACAHVGYVSNFEQDGGIICPKCRTRNLIVGADFEHLNGPYHCLDCDWTDTELDTVGQCMKCELRFPMGQAIEEDLIGYHVNRLDPLAFINAG